MIIPNSFLYATLVGFFMKWYSARVWVEESASRYGEYLCLYSRPCRCSGVSRRLSTTAALFEPGSGHVRFSFVDCYTPTSSVIRGWYSTPNSGRRTKWTHSHPSLRNYISNKESWIAEGGGFLLVVP
jgi:hypothetical protein